MRTQLRQECLSPLFKEHDVAPPIAHQLDCTNDLSMSITECSQHNLPPAKQLGKEHQQDSIIRCPPQRSPSIARHQVRSLHPALALTVLHNVSIWLRLLPNNAFFFQFRCEPIHFMMLDISKMECFEGLQNKPLTTLALGFCPPICYLANIPGTNPPLRPSQV